MTAAIGTHQEPILMIGSSSPLVEGVHDLLQVVGYPVHMSTNWTETQQVLEQKLPKLIIVDLSSASLDTDHFTDRMQSLPQWSHIPILFISFSGDDRIHSMKQRPPHNGNGHLHFYTHTFLNIDRLLSKVRTCIA